ncbi:MAG TPA: hypothetical protein VGD17_19140 [Chitinophagaceae bacterium]
MKNKAGYIILMIEIIAIIVLHSAKATTPEADKSNAVTQSPTKEFTTTTQKQQVSYSSLQ